MNEQERERMLGEFKGKTINRVILLHEEDEEFNDVVTFHFSDMSKVSFNLLGSLLDGPK